MKIFVSSFVFTLLEPLKYVKKVRTRSRIHLEKIFILPFVFTPLKFIEKKFKIENRPLKFDLAKCPGSNRLVPCSNRPKIAVESLKMNFFWIFIKYKVEHCKSYNFCKNNFSNSASKGSKTGKLHIAPARLRLWDQF